MIRFYSRFNKGVIRRHGLVVSVLAFGALIDLAVFSTLVRFTMVPEPLAVVSSILVAGLLNYLMLERLIHKEEQKSRKKRLFGLLVYLLSVLTILAVRVLVLTTLESNKIYIELLYVFAMGVSFVSNWLILSVLFGEGKKNRSMNGWNSK